MITLKRLKATNFKRLGSVDLIFPARGSILIEGQNEAGKSTLFEAVYVALYGEPLVGEENRARLDDVIQHGQPRASVALTFLVSQQEFTIERIFEREKSQRVQLTIQRPGDAPPESISRTGAVKERIFQELHNLDGESLRNSCFVEQKELGRLEALSFREREEAIRKLLGLERLTRLAEQFRFRREQERELALAERRLALAYAQEETRQAIAAEAALAERLDAARVASALERRSDLETQQAQAQQELMSWRRQEQAAQVRLQRCQAISSQLRTCEQVAQHIGEARREREAMTQAQEELARLDRVEQEELPAARGHLAQVEQTAKAIAQTQAARQAVREAEEAVRVAQRNLDDLTQAEAHVDNLDKQRAVAQQRQKEANRLRAALEAAEREVQLAQQQANRAVARDALEGWVRLKEVELRIAGYAAQRAAMLAQRQAAEAALATARSRTRRPLLLASGLSILTLVLVVAGFFWLPIFGLAVLALIGSGIAWLWFAKARAAIPPRINAVQAVVNRLQEVEVYRQAAIQAGGDPAALNQHERQLQMVGSKAPPTLEDGRVWLEQLRAEAGPSMETHQLQRAAQGKRDQVILLNEQVRQARQTTKQVRDALYAASPPSKPGQRLSASSAQASLQQETEALIKDAAEVLALIEQALLAAQQIVATKGASNPAAELEAARAQLASTQAACRDREAGMQRLIQHLGLAAENEVGPELGRAGEQVRALEKDLANRPAKQEERERRQAALTGILVETRDQLAGVVDAARQQEVGLSQPLLSNLRNVAPEHLDENILQTALSEITRTLEAALMELDEQETRASRDRALHAQGTIKTRLEQIQQNAEQAKQTINAILAGRHFQPPTVYTSASIAEIWPLLAKVSAAEHDGIARDHDLARQKLYAAQGQESKLAERLQAAGLQLDIGECEQRVNALREERAICEQATELIKEAHDRIVRRILPITERNMQPLLHQLTGGRYRDVRLTPDEGDGQANQLDYRIRVWDQAAGRYVAKNLFSGGTRDQCSLALRLAFALATLPQELGVAPGFIFLDEPLSAFDAQRAQALVELVTAGTIAANFHQVVLISHHHAFDPAAFQFHVRMEAGQVVESDLPQQELEAGHERVLAVAISKHKS